MPDTPVVHLILPVSLAPVFPMSEYWNQPSTLCGSSGLKSYGTYDTAEVTCSRCQKKIEADPSVQ